MNKMAMQTIIEMVRKGEGMVVVNETWLQGKDPGSVWRHLEAPTRIVYLEGEVQREKFSARVVMRHFGSMFGTNIEGAYGHIPGLESGDDQGLAYAICKLAEAIMTPEEKEQSEKDRLVVLEKMKNDKARWLEQYEKAKASRPK